MPMLMVVMITFLILMILKQKKIFHGLCINNNFFPLLFTLKIKVFEAQKMSENLMKMMIHIKENEIKSNF